MKFVKLSQNLRKYALNVRSVTLGYAHIYKKILLKFIQGSSLEKIFVGKKIPRKKFPFLRKKIPCIVPLKEVFV